MQLDMESEEDERDTGFLSYLVAKCIFAISSVASTRSTAPS